ncbi:hypothetical protein Hdeb2414_s0003g00085331 [Helianthus debilis subsp. tardiflorus]
MTSFVGVELTWSLRELVKIVDVVPGRQHLLKLDMSRFFCCLHQFYQAASLLICLMLFVCCLVIRRLQIIFIAVVPSFRHCRYYRLHMNCKFPNMDVCHGLNPQRFLFVQIL